MRIVVHKQDKQLFQLSLPKLVLIEAYIANDEYDVKIEI